MLKKRLSLLILFLFLSQLLTATERYDKVRIWTDNTNAALSDLVSLGVDPEGISVRRGAYVDVILNQWEKEQVRERGLIAEDIIRDLSTYYETRLAKDASREFGFGSMGGYYTYAEIIASLDSLHVQHPMIVSAKDSIGSSLEGRTIWAIKVSDNPDVDEDEPEVLFNSLIHAREPSAMMTLMYFAWELVENYNVDPLMTYLVNEREIWFVPVVNPDGYVYNQQTNPSGGGMHRKNMRPGCTEVPGVDLNRNWGYKWGPEYEGSSSYMCSETYRGTAAFSEPETQIMRDFVLTHNFQTAFNYHSYSDLLLGPFGYHEDATIPEPDNAIYQEMGQDLVRDNGYQFGTGTDVLYVVNGDAVDWMYGDQGIINFTPEVGGWEDGGFWPTMDLIYELAEENLSMNLHLACVGGACIRLNKFELLFDGALVENMSYQGQFELRNKGLMDDDKGAVVKLTSPDSSLLFEQSRFELNTLGAQQSNIFEGDDLLFTVNAGYGEYANLVVELDVGNSYLLKDTLIWKIGVPDTLFLDDFESGMHNWESDVWGLSGEGYESNTALSDSPTDNYSNDSEVSVTLVEGINLRGKLDPILEFNASWDIEKGWDFVQVSVSCDSSNTWQPLQGSYTVSGNGLVDGAQPLDEPGYDGVQGWIQEQISLISYVGCENLRIKFQLLSDAVVTENGFSVDNIRVLAWGEHGVLPGDMNWDISRNIQDIVLIIQMVMGQKEVTDIDLYSGDLNGDGILDIRDITILIETVLGN